MAMARPSNTQALQSQFAARASAKAAQAKAQPRMTQRPVAQPKATTAQSWSSAWNRVAQRPQQQPQAYTQNAPQRPQEVAAVQKTLTQTPPLPATQTPPQPSFEDAQRQAAASLSNQASLGQQPPKYQAVPPSAPVQNAPTNNMLNQADLANKQRNWAENQMRNQQAAASAAMQGYRRA